MKKKPTVAAVIGDLVASRSHEREALHATLLTSLSSLDITSDEPLHPTVGDEIQGIFATLGEALRATQLLRLTLRAAEADIRFGIGVGTVSIIDPSRNIQDGSAWWNARTALEAAEHRSTTTGYSGVRTGIECGENAREGADASKATVGPSPLALSALALIDAHVSTLKPSVCESLLGILRDEPNAHTAERLGISPSANTQRATSNDLRPLADAMKASWMVDSPFGQDLA